MATMNSGHGLIATLVRGDEVIARHFKVALPHYIAKTMQPGSAVGVAIRELVAFCDAGGWKVRTISTPATILRDLDGPRKAPSIDGQGEVSPIPERSLLGRLDLIEEPAHTTTTTLSPFADRHRHRGR